MPGVSDYSSLSGGPPSAEAIRSALEILEWAPGFAAVYRPSAQAGPEAAGTHIGQQQNYTFGDVHVDDRGYDFITRTVGYQQSLMGPTVVGDGSGAVRGSLWDTGASE